MMTDERQGGDLFWALERMPRGAGIVFRHYSLPLKERRALFAQVRAVAQRRKLVLVAASPHGLGPRWALDGVHGLARTPLRYAPRAKLLTRSAHDMRELRRAANAGADLVFLSPVFPTRSHPGGRHLGPLRFAGLASRSAVPVVALGGMTAARARRLRGIKMHGWAAIDAWSAD